MCLRCKAINCFPRVYALRFCLFLFHLIACDNQFHNFKLKTLSEEMIKSQYAYIKREFVTSSEKYETIYSC